MNRIYWLVIKMTFNSLWCSLRSYKILSAVSIVIFIMNCSEAEKSNLVIICNENIEVGILPEIGGRIVLMRIPGYKNILKADQKLWLNPEKYKPEISAFSDFEPFNGHIVWVGPQSEWWVHQEVNVARRDKKANWPSDPYLIYGNYEIAAHNDTYIKLIGPASPVSGVRLIKEISIEKKAAIKFKVTAENIRDENVSLDLWMNTRLDGFAKGYVPVDENGILEFLKSESEISEVTPYKIEQGYFYFNPSIPAYPRREQVQEVHLDPRAGYIAGFNHQQMLIIRFEKINRLLIHPEHGLVELYNFVNETGDDTLLELEVHSPYRTLLPGEKMSFTEFWELYPYHEVINDDQQINFLQSYINRL